MQCPPQYAQLPPREQIDFLRAHKAAVEHGIVSAGRSANTVESAALEALDELEHVLLDHGGAPLASPYRITLVTGNNMRSSFSCLPHA